MTDLKRLNVSLTKHGAHKIARLLKSYGPDQVLSKMDDPALDIHIDSAQARKNLSVQENDHVPEVWRQSAQLGDEAIDALVLLAIIFSHHELISSMGNADAPGRFSGTIRRDVQLSGKEYTNLSHVVDQLGYASKVDHDGVTFDLEPMFKVDGLGGLAGQLVELKLDAAGWDRSSSFEDEIERLGLHEVFHVDASELRDWFAADKQPESSSLALVAKDEDFFAAVDEPAGSSGFSFRPGHVERAVNPVPTKERARTKAHRLHNEIQNRLYKSLSREIGDANVGTEQGTGVGTSIDLVVQEDSGFTFYEIKTADSVRANIRQAVPQLLEYAYWPNAERAQKLVIVSHIETTEEAERYLAYLRERFSIPIYYEQYDLTEKDLEK